MGEAIGKLTVFFENQFWIGVFERIENGKKEQKEAEEQRMFELKQRKRLEKHKGH